MKTHQGLIIPQLHRCVSADQTDIRYKHDPEQILSLSASLTLWTQWTCSVTSPISSFMVCVCSCSSFICSNMVSLPPLNRQTQKNKGSNITASACMLSPFKQSEVTVTETNESRGQTFPHYITAFNANALLCTRSSFPYSLPVWQTGITWGHMTRSHWNTHESSPGIQLYWNTAYISTESTGRQTDGNLWRQAEGKSVLMTSWICTLHNWSTLWLLSIETGGVNMFPDIPHNPHPTCSRFLYSELLPSPGR